MKIYTLFALPLTGSGALVCALAFSVPQVCAQDYRLIVSNAYARTLAGISLDFPVHTIDASFDRPNTVHAADVDSDGYTDVISASTVLRDDVAWWRNVDGTATNWLKRTVDMASGSAEAVHSGDVDGDGDTDIVGAAYAANALVWWENIGGEGTNWTKHTVATSFRRPTSIQAIDLDGDLDLDMVAAGSLENAIAWWENSDSNGTMWLKHDVSVSVHGPRQAFAADLDGNGSRDIAVAAYGADEISWWSNQDGGGTTWTKHVISDAFNGALAVHVADVNGDGSPDVLAAASIDHTVAWWENDGGSNWTMRVVDDTFSGAFDVYGEDLDGDGDIDVLSASASSKTVSWWENLAGDGTQWTPHTVETNYNIPKQVRAADLNGDALNEVLGVAYYEDQVDVWLNTTPGWVRFPPPCETNWVTSTADLEARSDADTIALGPGTQLVCRGWSRFGSDPGSGSGSETGPFTFTNDTVLAFEWETEYETGIETSGPGTTDVHSSWFPAATSVVVEALPLPGFAFEGWSGDLPAGDTNSNPLMLTVDRPRAVTATFGSGPFALTVSNEYTTSELRRGVLTFEEIVVDRGFGTSAMVDIGDVDQDGTQDIIGCAYGENAVAWWANPGGGGTNWVRHMVDDAVERPAFLSVPDMDEDGDLDCLATLVGHGVYWWENLDATGTLWGTHAVIGWADRPQYVSAADLDADGDPDLLGAGQYDNTLYLWENVDARATNWVQRVLDEITRPRSLLAVDVDRDGDRDIVAVGYQLQHGDSGLIRSGDVNWYENADGSGTEWIRHMIDEAMAGGQSVVAGDIDGDGDQDIVCALPFSEIVVYENLDGAGRTWLKSPTDGGDHYVFHGDLKLSDLDEDGDLDVLIGKYGICLVNEDGEGTTWTRRYLGSPSSQAAVADIDEDGWTDVVAAQPVAWYRNELEVDEIFASPGDAKLVEGGLGQAVVTQHVLEPDGVSRMACIGWERAGSDPASGHAPNTDLFAFTNDARVTFHYERQYYLDTAVDGNGLAGLGPGWYPAGAQAVLTPSTTELLYVFAGWSGDLPASRTNENPLVLTMDRSWRVTAHFVRPICDLIVVNPLHETHLLTQDWAFAEHGVQSGIDGPRAVDLADMDGDYEMDILLGSYGDDEISWWEPLDDTATNWQAHIISGFGNPSVVVAADVDGDGDQDTLSGSSGGGLVLWENLDGRDEWPRRLISSDFADITSIRAVDVDKDGDLDVVAGAVESSGNATSGLAWWENLQGNGHVWTEHNIYVAGDVNAVDAADVDGDGDVDIASTLGTHGSLDGNYWWEDTDGGSTNWVGHLLSSSGQHGDTAHIVDMDQDGDQDILFQYAWWENIDGAATQWAERPFPMSFRRGHPVDLDGDGDTDVAGSSYDSSAVFFAENLDGKGEHWRTETQAIGPGSVAGVAPGDVDGDGFPDLALAYGNALVWLQQTSFPASIFSPVTWTNRMEAEVGVVLTTSEEGLSLGSTQVVYEGWTRSGSAPTSMAARSTGPFVLTNDTVVTFQWKTQYWFEAVSQGPGDAEPGNGWYDAGSNLTVRAVPADLAQRFTGWSGDVADAQTNQNPVVLPLDGARAITAHFETPVWDVVVVNPWSDTLLSTHAWHFSQQQIDPAADWHWRGMHPADLDGDGDVDLLTSEENAQRIIWYENSDGYGGAWTLHTITSNLFKANMAIADDFDGDGDLDVLGSATQDPITWWENLDGRAKAWTPHSLPGAQYTRLICSGDVNGDGRKDILGAQSISGDDIAWWLNVDGTGTNLAKVLVESRFNRGMSALNASDIDGDGDLDVLAVWSDLAEVLWWENLDGTGTNWLLHSVGSLPTNRDATRLQVADLDQDGDQDVLGSFLWYPEGLFWWENVGGDALSWLNHTILADYGSGRGGPFQDAVDISTSDVDRDGDVDILTATRAGSLLLWVENRHARNGDWVPHVISNGTAYGLCVADVDGDGFDDAMVDGGYTPSWWRTAAQQQDRFYPNAWTNSTRASMQIAASAHVPAAGNGTTQHLVSGWVRTGSDPGIGNGPTTGVFALTNHVSITYSWDTQYWLDTEAHGPGIVDVDDHWMDAGSSTSIFATAEAYYHLHRWEGDTDGASGVSAQLNLVADRPRHVAARFAPNKTPHGTPEWWLATHGWSNEFEMVDGLDPDEDRSLTWQEWVAGTDPTNAWSVLRFLNVSNDTAGVVHLTFTSVPGRQYRLFGAVGSPTSHWTLVETTGGAGETVAAEDETTVQVEASSEARLYRLQVTNELTVVTFAPGPSNELAITFSSDSQVLYDLTSAGNPTASWSPEMYAMQDGGALLAGPLTATGMLTTIYVHPQASPGLYRIETD